MRIIKLLANYSPLIVSITIHLIVLIVYQFSKLETTLSSISHNSQHSQHQIKFDLHSLPLKEHQIKETKTNQKYQELKTSGPELITEKSNASDNLSELNNSANSKLGTSTNEAIDQFPSPEYPKMARLKNQEGSVLISVLFDDLGNASSVKILESSKNIILDEAATKAAKNWKVPAKSMHELKKRIIFKLN